MTTKQTYLPNYLPIYLSTYLTTYLPTYLLTYLPTYNPGKNTWQKVKRYNKIVKLYKVLSHSPAREAIHVPSLLC